MLPNIIIEIFCLFGRKRVFGQRNKTESEALTFKIESCITPLTCAGTKSMVHYSISSSFEIPMITLAFMKSKQAYLEELKHLAQYLYIQSESISGVLMNFYPNR